MTKPELTLYIVESTNNPGLLSIRLKPGDRSASGLKKAIKDAGFKAGQKVKIVVAND